MNITKLENGTENPIIKGRTLSAEELQNEFHFYLAEKITRKMLENGVITADEFNKISENNKLIFSPCLREIIA